MVCLGESNYSYTHTHTRPDNRILESSNGLGHFELSFLSKALPLYLG